MKKKKVFYTELAYLLGLLSVAFGVAFMERADFGVSMVVAPAYVLYLKISQFLPFFTFGMAEYTLQAVLLIVLFIVLRKFRASYLFSFVTAVLYGFMLDGCMALLNLIPKAEAAGADGFSTGDAVWLRVLFFIVGMLCCSLGVSLVFHTYIPPEVYELFVSQVSKTFSLNINHVKTAYDISSMTLGVVLSFLFFGMWHFEGVKWGTLICALLNGFIIGKFSKLFEHFFDFKDGLRLRKFFQDAAEKEEQAEKT